MSKTRSYLREAALWAATACLSAIAAITILAITEGDEGFFLNAAVFLASYAAAAECICRTRAYRRLIKTLS